MTVERTLTIGQQVTRVGLALLSTLVLVFLVAPIVIIVPLSFSSGSFFYYPLPGFSLRWYEDFVTSSFWLPSVWNSLIVGTTATLLATVLGTLAALGIWRGLKLTRPTETIVVREVEVPAPSTFVRNDARLEALGITPRELEILGLIAAGLSNREIAERIFVSENTVKTHANRLFDKLNAKRRTQAVQVGKELGLIP